MARRASGRRPVVQHDPDRDAFRIAWTTKPASDRSYDEGSAGLAGMRERDETGNEGKPGKEKTNLN